jgi:hypothetical protein
MCSDHDRFEIQKKNFLPNPSVIAQPKLPRKMNVHTRLDINLAAHVGTE